MDPLRLRFAGHCLTRHPFRDPADLVAWLGAVQAQDFPGARWALGLRLAGVDDAAIRRAFDEGRILRTHVLRPTWHLVAPHDIRWLLALTGPRVQKANGFSYRTNGLDRTRLVRGAEVIVRALEGGRHLTRAELRERLVAAKLPHGGNAIAHLIIYAELEGLICSGPLRGRQGTYALLDERVPPTAPLDPDEALGELTRRYFTSHGPATIRDFTWWAGLTAAQAKRGIEIAGTALASREIDGLACWFAPSVARTARRGRPNVLLLPNFDEFLVAYRDRQWTMRPGTPAARYGLATPLPHQVLIDGVVEGAWRRRDGDDGVELTVQLWRPLDRIGRTALAAQADRLAAFLGARATMTMAGSARA